MGFKAKRLTSDPVKLALDIALFVAFLITTAPRFSGVPIHEWLSLALAFTVIVHLLLNWKWIVTISKRFLKAVQWEARLNYVLNWLLFIDMTVLVFTGFMISRFALPAMGIYLPLGGPWESLHRLTAEWSLYLMGLHIAFNWSWVVRAVKNLFASVTKDRQAAPVQENAQL